MAAIAVDLRPDRSRGARALVTLCECLACLAGEVDLAAGLAEEVVLGDILAVRVEKI